MSVFTTREGFLQAGVAVGVAVGCCILAGLVVRWQRQRVIATDPHLRLRALTRKFTRGFRGCRPLDGTMRDLLSARSWPAHGADITRWLLTLFLYHNDDFPLQRPLSDADWDWFVRESARRGADLEVRTLGGLTMCCAARHAPVLDALVRAGGDLNVRFPGHFGCGRRCVRSNLFWYSLIGGDRDPVSYMPLLVRYVGTGHLELPDACRCVVEMVYGAFGCPTHRQIAQRAFAARATCEPAVGRLLLARLPRDLVSLVQGYRLRDAAK